MASSTNKCLKEGSLLEALFLRSGTQIVSNRHPQNLGLGLQDSLSRGLTEAMLKNNVFKKLVEEIRQTSTAMAAEEKNLKATAETLEKPNLSVAELQKVFEKLPRWMENLRKATWQKYQTSGLKRFTLMLQHNQDVFQKFESLKCEERNAALESTRTFFVIFANLGRHDGQTHS